ncbi:MAG TPA: hypothetical protein VHW24_05880, partial [Bryobacteraceae bacterium]|nr:hypothetical protein [Bryobacteraceae bacterium]
MLTNPDHRLRFPEDSDTTRTIDLPTDGSWANFELSGADGSQKLKDAVIEVHCGTAAGALLLTKPVTVFWFDNAHIDVTAGGKYSNFGDATFKVIGAPAVKLKATARLRPAGVDCSDPQIKDLRVGIIQNSMPPDGSKSRIRNVLYGPPTMDWDLNAPANIRVKLPQQWRRTMTSDAVSNDSTADSAPFYGLPKAHGSTKPSEASPPVGCKSGGSTESQDDPGTPLHGSIKVRVTDGSGHAPLSEPVTDDFGLKLETAPVINGAGKTVGTASYPFQQVFHKEKWITWAVIFNVKTKAFCCLRQRAWTVDLDSNSSDDAHLMAVPEAADAAATTAPVTGAPFSNTINDDPKNWSTGSVGSAT